MSSHHFVKEGQEPALFVLGKSSFQFAEPLLEWVPLVIVADRVLEDVLQWGIKIDVVIQCESKLDEIERFVIDQQPVQILTADHVSVITRGLQFLVEQDCDAVNIISPAHNEIFHAVEAVAPRLQVGIYTVDVKWLFITSGIFEKWMPSSYGFFIRANDTPLQTSGVVQKAEKWETLSESMVTIKAKTPFWIGEPY